MHTKKKNILVSVLLNCYNSEKFISKAINSVINQTYNNWELIIWDDCSSDKTLNLVKKYKDQRIRIFSNKKNLGLGKSRINAIKYINGSLVSILDSDDYFHKEKLYKQVKIFKKYPNIALCSTWSKLFRGDNNFIRSIETDLKNENLKKKLLYINFLPHSSLMYRADIAKKVGWYSRRLEFAQDYDLTLKLLEKNDIYIIKEHLTFIGLDYTNMSFTERLKPTIFNENISILKKNLLKNSISHKEKKIIKNIIDINLLKLSVIKMKKNSILGFVELINILLKNPLILFRLKLLRLLSEQKKL